MITSKVIIFPDTNFFLQCKDIGELDWGLISDSKDFTLIVTRTVQREIDNQKNNGGDRVAKKARRAATLFKEIIVNSKPEEEVGRIIWSKKTKILVKFSNIKKLNQGTNNDLDYTYPDDQIAGEVRQYIFEHPNDSVVLVTGDTGLLLTARNLEIPYSPIPNEWLLPPPNTELEKENKRLKAEISKLLSNSPVVEIATFANLSSEPIEKAEFDYTIFSPLEPKQVTRLKQSMVTKHSLEKQLKNTPNATGFTGVHLGQKFIPPSETELTEYKLKTYPNWVRNMEDVLESINLALQLEQETPKVLFKLTNIGTKPAESVVVKFEVKGNFEIKPSNTPKKRKKLLQKIKETIQINRPPQAPKGKYTNIFETLRLAGSRRNLINIPHFDNRLSNLGNTSLSPLDPNEFHNYPEAKNNNGKSVRLSCEKWQHGLEAKVFEIDILPNLNMQKIEKEETGAIVCSIYSSNMPEIVEHIIPISFSIGYQNSLIFAEEKIEKA
jgi:hypothetical protein